jgi:membrane-associated protease RseP (regulator of RpoE activity)
MAIRDRVPSRRALFDIGVAGPLAGLAACLVVLAIGSVTGHVTVPLSGEATGGDVVELGVPLLWEPALRALGGAADAGHALGPVGLAVWFGLLLTGLNLMPIGQLDGGHVLYAVFPRHARLISRFAWLGGVALAVLTPAWLFWGLIIGFLGRRGHPATVDDSLPVGDLRSVIAVAALAVFVLTFVPQPIVYTWGMLLRGFGFWSY